MIPARHGAYSPPMNNDPQPLVQFPVPSTLTLYFLAGLVIAGVVAVLALDSYRRRKLRRERLARDWESVRVILEERGIFGDDAQTIERLLKTHLPREPLRGVTTREGFETLVSSEVEAWHAIQQGNVEKLGIRLRAIREQLGLDYVPPGQQIVSTRELHDGQWIAIAPADADEPEWIRVMVEDVNEAYFYVVLKPRTLAAPPLLHPGQRIRCTVFRDEDGRYAFETDIAAYDHPPPTWRLHHTHDFVRTQNRADYRVRHDQSVMAHVFDAPLHDDGPRAGNTITRIPGRITSLSAGGCAMVFKQPVARRVRLVITLELPSGQPIETEVAIVGSATISGGRYLVRGRFRGLSDEDRDRIARYVTYRQRKRIALEESKR